MSDARRGLRVFTIGAGVAAALAFVAVGLAFHLQTYGDGSIFSYAVATREVWAFHWHNIATRAAVWALTLAPGELAVALTGAPTAGVAVYGLCLFAAPAASLAAVFALDRAAGRLYFVFACASTALLAPLVFGFPTEMWIAHALFWPAFACAMTFPVSRLSGALLAALTTALVLSHEGGLVLGFGLVVATALRGLRDARFFRALASYGFAVAAWLAVNHFVQPDAYFGEVRLRAASEFFEAKIFASPLLLLLVATLAAYALACALLLRFFARRAPLLAAIAVAGALVLWWATFDHALHADNRYYLRTILLVGTCGLAAVAGLMQLVREETPVARIAPVRRALDALRADDFAGAVIGAVALVLFVHVVETAKFVRGFTAYRAAVRALALGEAADPQLGAPFFVSSQRIDADLDRLSWFSTTPYLSAVVADFRPKRLVIDPAGNYFWLSCATATQAAQAGRAVVAETREMIRVYSCLHRD
ncbi:MAG TPA: hypothetical protein PKA55_14435 [Rhodoblastus sp.]|nr:hypothetical protein [Rhodoblastus sp.]